MIKSRKPTKDLKHCCARCKHLHMRSRGSIGEWEYVCGIDGIAIPDGAICFSFCDKFKEVDNGTTVHAGPEAD